MGEGGVGDGLEVDQHEVLKGPLDHRGQGGWSIIKACDPQLFEKGKMEVQSLAVNCSRFSKYCRLASVIVFPNVLSQSKQIPASTLESPLLL